MRRFLTFKSTIGASALAAVCLQTITAHADVSPLTPDRPGFTNGSDVVPVGLTHLELGIGETWTPSSAGGGHTTDYPEILIRHGVTPALEFRVSLPDRFAIGDGGPSGWGDAAVGVKWKFYQSKDGNTKAALFPMATIPSHDANFSSGQVDPSLVIGAQTTSGSRWGLSANIGLTDPTQNGSRNFSTAPSAAAQYQITPKLSTYGELYDNVPKTGPSSPIADGGLILVPNPNTQYDIEAGWGLGSGAPVRFVGGGVSLRF